MHHEKRKLMLAICNNINNIHLVTHPLYYLECFFPEAKLIHALKWLVRNKLIGERFVEWYRGQCVGSNLEMHRELMAAVEKAEHTRTLLASKDLKNA